MTVSMIYDVSAGPEFSNLIFALSYDTTEIFLIYQTNSKIIESIIYDVLTIA